MTLPRLKYLMLLAAGLLAAGPAAAGTLTVYATMTGAQVAPTDPLFAVASVTGAPIDCPTNYTSGMAGKACAADVTGTVVLTAAGQFNATAVAWSGCPAISTVTNPSDTCTVTMGAAAQTVQATFRPTLYPLVLTTFGKMVSTGLAPPGDTAPAYPGYLTTAGTAPLASCQTKSTTNTACRVAAANGAAVAVVAIPGAGQRVASWTGCTVDALDLTGSTCNVALNQPRGVTATFGPTGVPVTAQVQGSGNIRVTQAGVVTDGINCGNGGTDCSGQVTSGGAVSFTATAANGAAFVGWSGACAGAALTCTVTNVTSPKAVAATFKATSCLSCHATPPASHAGLGTLACGTCHAGYSTSSVNPAAHMNGTSTATNPKVVAPASFGLALQIVGAGLDGSNRPFVDVKATDAAGVAINVPAAITANEFTSSTGSSRILRFAFGENQADGSFLSRLAPVTSPASGVGSNPQNIPTVSETSKATSYVDQTGGVYRFTFATSAQAGLDTTRTFRAVVYGARFFKPGAGQADVQYPSSDYHDFSPTGTVVPGKETVTDAACNKCHGALTLHGMRRGVAICLTCHNLNTGLGGSLVTSSLPTGRAAKAPAVWDLKNLVHKLHSGKNDVAWGTTFDASTMKMAPSHALYFEGGNSVAGTGAPLVAVVDPELVTECGICHQGADANSWATKPSKAACTSCHDATDPFTGLNHDGGIAASDATCFACHQESGAIVPGAIYPVKTVHGRFYEPAHNFNFAALPGFPADGHKFKVTLVNVTANTAGLPTFTVDVSLDDAPFDIKGVLTTPSTAVGRVATCAFQIAGPTTDYTIPGRPYASPAPAGVMGSTAASCTSGAAWTFVSSNATSSRFSFTPASGAAATYFASVPAGYYTASFEIMWQRVALASNGDYVRKPFSADPNLLLVKSAADHSAAAVTDPVEQGLHARRTVVEFGKCNACHEDLGFHSNRGRKGPDYCDTCHNPKLDNASRVRAKQSETKTFPGYSGTFFLPESVSMNVFIHRIHMGADLPSVKDPANASPWVPVAGKVSYGALRGTTTIPNAALGEVSDFSKFGMPNQMGNCDQCHISIGAKKTWALNENPGLAAVERTLKDCTNTTVDPADGTTRWCNVVLMPGSTSAAWLPPTANVVVTPPLKATCTSCHDSAAIDTHADLNTINPMTAGATELCAGCHGAGKAFDSILAHQPIP